ncbi:uncharacterized protein LOC136088955 [Hydra vulgaris]|uniref:Uncharacterized protein LOC136088955 n=1 Tax=Hydra vulgaris TaxID=6087 RepID=A0ABM4D7M0_HYDVU
MKCCTPCIMLSFTQKAWKKTSKIENDSAWLRRNSSTKLRTALATQNVNIMRRKYLLFLPDISVHRNHQVGNEASISQALSKNIINEIAELVKQGVNTVSRY